MICSLFHFNAIEITEPYFCVGFMDKFWSLIESFESLVNTETLFTRTCHLFEKCIFLATLKFLAIFRIWLKSNFFRITFFLYIQNRHKHQFSWKLLENLLTYWAKNKCAQPLWPQLYRWNHAHIYFVPQIVLLIVLHFFCPSNNRMEPWFVAMNLAQWNIHFWESLGTTALADNKELLFVIMC